MSKKNQQASALRGAFLMQQQAIKKEDYMDISPYIGTIATVIIAFGGLYAAISSRLTRTETMIESLGKTVDKHNEVIERTYKLETEVDNLYHRYDELKKGE